MVVMYSLRDRAERGEARGNARVGSRVAAACGCRGERGAREQAAGRSLPEARVVVNVCVSQPHDEATALLGDGARQHRVQRRIQRLAHVL